jgi:hypothetical protein
MYNVYFVYQQSGEFTEINGRLSEIYCPAGYFLAKTRGEARAHFTSCNGLHFTAPICIKTVLTGVEWPDKFWECSLPEIPPGHPLFIEAEQERQRKCAK